MHLINITRPEYDVEISIAYATPNNFTGKPVYRKDAKCYLNEVGAELLHKAVALAKTQGYRFIIYDAYRPTEAQWKLWEHTSDPGFLADPAKGSVSYVSPVARALLGKGVGDTAMVAGGEVEIIEIAQD